MFPHVEHCPLIGGGRLQGSILVSALSVRAFARKDDPILARAQPWILNPSTGILCRHISPCAPVCPPKRTAVIEATSPTIPFQHHPSVCFRLLCLLVAYRSVPSIDSRNRLRLERAWVDIPRYMPPVGGNPVNQVSC